MNRDNKTPPVDNSFLEEASNILKNLEKEHTSPIVYLYTLLSPELPGRIFNPAEHFILEQLRQIKRYQKISFDQKIPKITLIVSSLGGSITTVLNIIKLIKENCELFSVIVPSKALGAASLLALTADELIVAKDSLFSPFGPLVTNQNNSMPSTLALSDITAVLDQNISNEKKAELLLSLYKNTNSIVVEQALQEKNQIKSALMENFEERGLEMPIRKALLSLFLEDNLPQGSLITVKDITQCGLHVLDLLEEQTTELRHLYSLMEEYSYPYPIQSILDFYKGSNSCYLNFSISLLSVLSAITGLTSHRSDMLTAYCGDREKISRATISFNPSSLYTYTAELDHKGRK